MNFDSMRDRKKFMSMWTIFNNNTNLTLDELESIAWESNLTKCDVKELLEEMKYLHLVVEDEGKYKVNELLSITVDDKDVLV